MKRKITLAVILSLVSIAPQLLAHNIFDAIRENDIKSVEKIIKKDQSKVNKKNKDDQTPLHTAIQFDRTEIIELLINQGAKLNLTNNKGQTPILYAAFRGDTKTVKLLINQGAKINPKTHTPFPIVERDRETITLLEAANKKQVELEKLLVQLKTNKDKDTIENIGNFISDKNTPAYIKIKAIVELIKFGNQNRSLNKSKMKDYVKQIPFNFDSLRYSILIEFAYYDQSVIDMNKRNLQDALCLYPTSEVIPFIFTTEQKEEFIKKLLNYAKETNNKKFARNLLNTMRIVSILSQVKPHLPGEIVGNIISFGNGELRL